ncbi:EAL domain-containing protein [Arvimicrobium flavum]|uniref:EAL domain-containing protein n=1 Tax=Arvimicrobium flavum TaxID=3393320 RepID=UPI00237B302E|nr:EAL domain-containing protein [Mesorhizobium shangrilense]
MVRLLSMTGPTALVVAIGFAFTLSLVATTLALRAARRANGIASDMSRLTASVDATFSKFLALRATSNGWEPHPQAHPEPSLPAPLEQPRPAASVARDSAPGDNVVRLPRLFAERRRGTDPALVNAVLAERTALERVELSLQPIVSVTTGHVCGFDVSRAVHGRERKPLVLRRISQPPPGFDIAAFERQTIVAAIEAGDSQLAGITDGPLHVAISDGLLDARRELDLVVELAHLQPAARSAVVLVVEARLFECPRLSLALQQLADAGIGFCVEADGAGAANALANPAVKFIRAPASRLIGDGGSGSIHAARLLAGAARADVRVIATDVSNDDDAIALLDVGVDLMMGDRFSGPTRLTPERGGGQLLRP